MGNVASIKDESEKKKNVLNSKTIENGIRRDRNKTPISEDLLSIDEKYNNLLLSLKNEFS